jgi:hypothetical protein
MLQLDLVERTSSTAMPAVPAMPTTEYSSAAYTFSMSRLAMRLPIVARRSPAIDHPAGELGRDDGRAVRGLQGFSAGGQRRAARAATRVPRPRGTR